MLARITNESLNNLAMISYITSTTTNSNKVKIGFQYFKQSPYLSMSTYKNCSTHNMHICLQSVTTHNFTQAYRFFQ